MKTNDPTTDEPPKEEDPVPVPALPDTTATDTITAAAEEETPDDVKGKPVPNSKPRPAPANPDDTYVYKDYAQTPLESLDTSTCHKKVPPQCLQAQKLPSKMAVMLVDPGEFSRILSVCIPLLSNNIKSSHPPDDHVVTSPHHFTCRSHACGQLATSREKLEDPQP